MATYKINLDSRRRRKDGTSQLTLYLRAKNQQRTISLDLHIEAQHWDAATGTALPSHPLHRQFNIKVGKIRLAVDEMLLLLPAQVGIDEFAAAVLATLFPERSVAKRRSAKLLDCVKVYQQRKTEPSTYRSYGYVVRHLEAFRPDATLDEVTPGWLQEFDAHLAKSAKSVNSRGIYMRNLRAVFNYAIDEGLTTNYPFRKFKIKKVETAKRSLSAADIRELATMDVEEWQEGYRDFFLLSFFLLGTNGKDILYLPAGADGGGRVEFNRSKTKKLYSIKVEPEAQAIINRYRGRQHLINTMDDRTDYMQYIRQCNHGLQMIGTRSIKGRKPQGVARWPRLTTYYARHTWATIAAELDIPKETIAAALGHDMGNTTTAIYINYNRRKVDEANRRVIDYVFGATSPATQ